VSRLLLDQIEQLRFPPAGGGEQRTAVVGTVRVGPRAVTVAAAHLSNKQEPHGPCGTARRWVKLGAGAARGRRFGLVLCA